MSQIPFTVYDFFGYLASGFIVLAAIVSAFVGYGPYRESRHLLIGLLLVILAYVMGHLVANLAGDVLERRIVRDRMHMPTEILVGAVKPGAGMRRAFPGYSTPLPAGVRDRVVERADAAGVRDQRAALFFHCHAQMKQDPAVQERLDTFLNLYGFCRNMAMAMVLAAIVLVVGVLLGTAESGPDVSPGWWIAAAVIAAVGMFYRYLKFFRQFAVELLTSYAEGDRK